MPIQTFAFLISLILLLFEGCAYVEYTGQWPSSDSAKSHPPPFNEQIFIRPNARFYEAGDPIIGVYTNHTSKTVYVVYPDGGGDNPLQKWNGENWLSINTKPEGNYYIQVVSYRSLEPGKSRKLPFPENRLREMDKEVKGTYRFSFDITTDRESGNTTTIHSREFTIW